MSVTAEDVGRARAAIGDVARHTPVLPSATLSERAGGTYAIDPTDSQGLRTQEPVVVVDLKVPARELEQQRAWEERMLTGTEWIDSVNGVVRIPVERAIELSLQEGFPVRAEDKK